MLGDTGKPPPEGWHPPLLPNISSSNPSTTPVQTGGGPDTPQRMRTFEEIIADEKKESKYLDS